jgi:hypothetical protein
MSGKYRLIQGVVALLVTVLLVLTASAQPRNRDRDRDRDRDSPKGECKEMLNAAGRAKFRPFTQKREREGRGAAMADAIANWQRDVSAKYGSQWMLWENAGDQEYTCAPSRPGTVGSWFIRCTIQARPCGGGPDNAGDLDKDPDDGGKQCSDYRRGRIIEAQRLMNGCNTCRREVDVDGVCGPTTERCLRDFQNSRFGRSKNLRVDGLPHRETVEALREYCR